MISQKDIRKNEAFASLREKYCGDKPTLAEINKTQKEKLEMQKQQVKKLKKS